MGNIINPSQKEFIISLNGEKLKQLSELDSIKGFHEAITKPNSWNPSSLETFLQIYQAIVAASEQAICPISNAYYGAVHIYQQDQQLLLYSGSNIDPESIELFKSPEHRNCAEKQAALAALESDKLSNAELRVMFLYRKSEPGTTLAAEKLIPCADCYQTYIEDLITNNGYLVLIIDDNKPREFLVPHHNTNANNDIDSVEVSGITINYKVFDAEAMKFLVVEEELGSRVSSETSLPRS